MSSPSFDRRLKLAKQTAAGGSAAGRRILRQRVREARARQAQHALAVAVLLGGRRRDGIADEQVHVRQAGGAEPVAPARLQRRQSRGEGAQPVAGRVTAEIEQHANALARDTARRSPRRPVHRPRARRRQTRETAPPRLRRAHDPRTARCECRAAPAQQHRQHQARERPCAEARRVEAEAIRVPTPAPRATTPRACRPRRHARAAPVRRHRRPRANGPRSARHSRCRPSADRAHARARKRRSRPPRRRCSAGRCRSRGRRRDRHRRRRHSSRSTAPSRAARRPRAPGRAARGGGCAPHRHVADCAPAPARRWPWLRRNDRAPAASPRGSIPPHRAAPARGSARSSHASASCERPSWCSSEASSCIASRVGAGRDDRAIARLGLGQPAGAVQRQRVAQRPRIHRGQPRVTAATRVPRDPGPPPSRTARGCPRPP